MGSNKVVQYCVAALTSCAGVVQAEELISRGAEPVTKDKQGNCAVHYAAAHGHTAILQVCGLAV